MAHFAVIAPPLPGHFNPLLMLSRELCRRGHRVTFVNQPDAERLVTDPEIGFVPVGAATHPPGSLDRRMRAMGRLSGVFGLRGLIAGVARFTDMLCREAPAALRRIGADAVIGDQMEAAAGLVAEHLRCPLVTVAAALPINREPAVPPPYLGWPYDASPRGQRRNRGGYRVADFLMHGVGEVIEHHARAFGLPPRRRAEDCVSALAQLAQAVAGIDFPRVELPTGFHYLGPFHGEGREDFALPQEDGRPLVFCSLGTLQGGRGSLFRNVAEACARLGLCLVIAHGGRLPRSEAERLPGNPLVFKFVRQRAVLRRAVLAVTHAGFNTVLDALSFGVPMVAIPLAFEQPATAARLRHAGVARVLARRKSSAGVLRMELAAALSDAGYRTRAAEIAREIGAAGGVQRAADIAISCLGTAVSPVAPRAASTREATATGGARGDSRSGSR